MPTTSTLSTRETTPTIDMERFTRLIRRIDQTTRTNERVAALAAYFDQADDRDRLWTIALLSHRRPRRTVTTRLLREWAAEVSGIPDWLFEQTYHVVGDLAETIAKVVPGDASGDAMTLSDRIEWLIDLRGQDEDVQRAAIVGAWRSMDEMQRFVFNKLLTGGFRIGISQKLMTRALSRHTGIDENELAFKLMGDWSPQTTTYHDLVLAEDGRADASRPYPFYLAYALEGEVGDLGDIAAWQAEWKWDGIRAQIVKRDGQAFVWSRGEELVNGAFPELVEVGEHVPDGTVVDGEIMAWDGEVRPFGDLQRRIGRKTVSRKMRAEVPVALFAYDLLEDGGEDVRQRPLHERRKRLEDVVRAARHDRILLSECIDADDWGELADLRTTSRARKAEGLMLKRLNAGYGVGRTKGDWWKWKVDPLTLDVVLLYAMRGHGRRANLYTDYTFAVRDGDGLVPVAKAYSGLTDREIRQVDAFVKKNTVERFGPVRSVTPELVFEIAFEGIRRSTRHKSGVAVRFPRIHRWRHDKPVDEIDTLETVLDMLDQVS